MHHFPEEFPQNSFHVLALDDKLLHNYAHKSSKIHFVIMGRFFSSVLSCELGSAGYNIE
jgi:hypothetical protein